MIRLKSYQEALAHKDQIPALALLRMEQLQGNDGQYCPESHGYLIVLQDGDHFHNLPEAGEYVPDGPQFEYARYVEEDGVRIFEVIIAIDNEKMIGVIFPETVPLTPEFRSLLEMYAEKEIITA